MFVSLPYRQRGSLRWATPLLLASLLLANLWTALYSSDGYARLLQDWGALAGGLDSAAEWRTSLQDGRVLRLFTALFLHADSVHLLAIWYSC